MINGGGLMSSLDVLNNAKIKKQRVGILGLGKYNEGFVKRIWFDDSDDIVELYIPENIKLFSMQDDILAELKEARIGVELWRYLLYMTILLLLIEMIVSNAKKQR